MAIQKLKRARYCPIGTSCNVKMLPVTFIKVCVAHQHAGVQKQAHGGFDDSGSLIHAIACSECPVGPHIRKGVDPVTIVDDVIWFTADELQMLQSGLSVVAKELRKASTYIRYNRKESYRMKAKLLHIKELLRQMDITLDELIKSSLFATPVEEKVEATIVPKERPIVKVEKDTKKVVSSKGTVVKAATLKLAERAYSLREQGVSRSDVAASLNVSPKYVSTLVAMHRKRLEA